MVTHITKARNITKPTLENMIGSLRAHGTIFQKYKPVKKDEIIALKTYLSEHENSSSLKENISKEDNEETHMSKGSSN